MNQKAKIQTLLDNTPFPGAGQSIGGHQGNRVRSRLTR